MSTTQTLEWYSKLYGASKAMPQSEIEDLLQWERENIDGQVGTSDWPGWTKYIGPCPALPIKIEPRRPQIPPKLRREVLCRDNHQCLRCGAKNTLCADHIFPYSKGGSTTLENLQTLCRSCNSKKGVRP